MTCQKSLLTLALPLFSAVVLSGCGSSPQPSFTIAALPASIVVANNGPAQAITVGATAINGFTGAISLAVSGLPPGVTANPASVTLTPGSLQQIWLSSANAAVATTPNVSIIGTSGSLSSSINTSLQVVPALTTATLSTTSFHFGDNLVGNTMTKSVVTVSNTGTTPLTLNPTLAGDGGFSISTTTFAHQCGSSLAAAGSCVLRVSFDPSTVVPATATATLSLGLGNVQANTSQTVALSGTAATLSAGTVTATTNPQVAQYTINLPFPGSVTVNFGLDTSYGRSTWAQSTSTAGPVSIFVAGMLPLSTYHMQAAIKFNNGINTTDVDQTFATQDSLLHPQITTVTTPGSTPQSGVEQLTFINGDTVGLVVTDLSGRILWSYAVANPGVGNVIQGARFLPDGHFLITIGQNSFYGLSSTTFPEGAIDSIREIDLAGNIIRQITTADVSAELAAVGHNVPLLEFHHDVEPLPNGHWLVLANTLKTFQDLPGFPGATSVLGDVVVDLDTNLQPVWVWNAFDHLDVNRHPFPLSFPDWTHANAITYTPSDGNFLISMRHQNWVLKINYQNGSGNGDVVWHLGQGGDFTLIGGVDPTDWFYAQHDPTLFSINSSGSFKLGLMDNGDDRQFAAGIYCSTPGTPNCYYSTVPVFQLDEIAKTATLIFHQTLSPQLYSGFGGNTELLANGNIEYDLTGEFNGGSSIFEVTNTPATQTVWQMNTIGSQAYRGLRLPSLYPGVQW